MTPKSFYTAILNWKNTVAMLKVLPKPLTVSHMDANGLFGTTKVSVFQLLQIYDATKFRVHHKRPVFFFFILDGKLKD